MRFLSAMQTHFVLLEFLLLESSLVCMGIALMFGAPRIQQFEGRLRERFPNLYRGRRVWLDQTYITFLRVLGALFVVTAGLAALVVYVLTSHKS